MMLSQFIMNNLSYQEAIRYFGFLLIWTIIIGLKLSSVKQNAFLAVTLYWIMTFGAMLAFSILGYIFAILGVILTIYCIVFKLKEKIGKK